MGVLAIALDASNSAAYFNQAGDKACGGPALREKMLTES